MLNWWKIVEWNISKENEIFPNIDNILWSAETREYNTNRHSVELTLESILPINSTNKMIPGEKTQNDITDENEIS